LRVFATAFLAVSIALSSSALADARGHGGGGHGGAHHYSGGGHHGGGHHHASGGHHHGKRHYYAGGGHHSASSHHYAPGHHYGSNHHYASGGRLHRSAKSRQQFELATGHRHGWPGHVIDHVVPLACGGADSPSNMQWQTVADAKAKDKVERKGCRGGRRGG
jgi:hypothetical protein